MIKKTQKHFHTIMIDGKEVGYIQLMNYNDSYPQIEYILDDEYHNKGIMTRELKNYLEKIKNYYKVIVAVVVKDNLASIRVLAKNDFKEILSPNNKYKSYMRIL